ncbi:type IV secretory system conjugative DNA transfer family protein [Streptomyces sp. NPDC015130]|uniref:type IV secretory system conjugative DNA transfer family protein n=1 Tax=Streptomyces sp. NPDC015130 TaxID=3364940 RepID=UPI0036FD4A89
MTTPTPNQTPTPTPTTPAAAAPRPAAERTVALATTIAPLVTVAGTPFLADSATWLTAVAYGGIAGFLGANYMNRLPDHVLAQIPGADIVRAHRVPLFAATLTTGMALAAGALAGPAGADALGGGILDLPSIPGILSLGWWAGVAFVPFQLRRVLRRKPHHTAHQPAAAGTYGPQQARVPVTLAEEITYLWAQHISNPHTGPHKLQELTLTALDDTAWSGTITAPIGTSVNVTQEKVSSVYQVRPDWVDLLPGGHAGEQLITVHRTAPAALDLTTLAGAWAKRVARSGGVLAHTHLEDIQNDPNTGGQVARVVADENLDKLPSPDRASLAGALRTTPLLVSYEPRQNPREAVIRVMDHNPLQEGIEFPGTHVLKANEQGYVTIGRGISGFPARIQLFDPKLGAQHALIAGVTGSGKGGTLQLIALAHHVNGSAIFNADPKGSSNPAIDKMAAYSGLGPDAAMGALRVWYALLQYRVAESARLGMKNFQPGPDRPWATLILDEASKLLGENAPHRKEATFIINAGATLARSLGMPLTIANQLMQLAQLGGDAAIRDNVFYGGSLILLRSDSQQKHLIDLPENFAGCNPADIPAAWTEDRALIFDPNLPENHPSRTFGLGFAASPGAHPEMMRNWLLEDATPYIDTNAIAYPADWPDWDRRDEIAATPVIDDGKEFDLDDSGLGTLGSMPPSLVAAPKKPETADEKILAALAQVADPAGLDVVYLHRDQIGALAGVKEQTLNNRLSALVKAGKIHRQLDGGGEEVRGMYGHGPAPAPAADDSADETSDSSD